MLNENTKQTLFNESCRREFQKDFVLEDSREQAEKSRLKRKVTTGEFFYPMVFSKNVYLDTNVDAVIVQLESYGNGKFPVCWVEKE